MIDGKEIEEIVNFLGSMKDGDGSEESAALDKYKFPRQNLLLSATLNEKVNNLAKMSLENPVLIGLDKKKIKSKPSNDNISEDSVDLGKMISSDGDYKLPAQLVQRYVKVPCGSRLMVLLSILKDLFERDSSQKVVLFFSTRDAVDFHYTLLSEFRWPTKSDHGIQMKQNFLKCKTFRLHGSMEHEDRRAAFHDFKSEKSVLLLSTDVAARGLDFPKVKCIIQYNSLEKPLNMCTGLEELLVWGKEEIRCCFFNPLK